jgi:hypothetical protein
MRDLVRTLLLAGAEGKVIMNSSKRNWSHYAWFLGGFLIGLTLISLGHASKNGGKRPLPTGPLNEIRSKKLSVPEMDAEFGRLKALESRYAESPEQQKRLQASTVRAARSSTLPSRRRN